MLLFVIEISNENINCVPQKYDINIYSINTIIVKMKYKNQHKAYFLTVSRRLVY